MADKIAINRITNANVYMNGNVNLLGKVEEITLPNIKIKTAEHKALGMIGAIELPSGLEKLEGKIKWTSFYEAELGTFAHPLKTIQLQVRGSLETYNALGLASEVPVVGALTILSKGLPLGAFKQNDNVELETDFAAYYVKLTVGGKDIVEVDVFANIYKAHGVDILANYRNNIGG